MREMRLWYPVSAQREPAVEGAGASAQGLRLLHVPPPPPPAPVPVSHSQPKLVRLDGAPGGGSTGVGSEGSDYPSSSEYDSGYEEPYAAWPPPQPPSHTPHASPRQSTAPRIPGDDAPPAGATPQPAAPPSVDTAPAVTFSPGPSGGGWPRVVVPISAPATDPRATPPMPERVITEAVSTLHIPGMLGKAANAYLQVFIPTCLPC